MKKLYDSKVLIVDDLEDNLELIEDMLDDEGYNNIISALSAKEAYEELEKNDIDLVILDVMMPEIDGIEACKYIKSKYKDIPVILATAKTDMQTLEDGFDAGANDYVKKPIVNDVELLARVKNAISLKMSLDNYKTLNISLESNLKEKMYLSTHDTLTGLLNRNGFNTIIEEIIEDYIQTKQSFALLFLDLDKFKEVNDTLGHHLGDVLLKDVAKRMVNGLRQTDIVARFGGDEFCLLLKDIKNLDDISVISQNINEKLAKPFVLDGQKVYTPCSIGIAIYPQDGITREELIKNADSAMYNSKYSGKNTFSYYLKEMNNKKMEALIMENNLREALSKGEFEVFYQPQIDAKKNIAIGLEALVRWIDPKNGIIPPNQFLHIAEAIGIMDEIDKFVIEQSIKTIKEFKTQHIALKKIAINLSLSMMFSENFVDFIKSLLQKYEIDGSYIEFEILENNLIEQPLEAIKILKELHNLSINISIDDFGTGYSSLSYLSKLPLDKLKIDKSFIDNIGNKENEIIIKTIISLSKNMGYSLLAEGVEEGTQKDFLMEHGCYNIQGYFYSKPLNKQDVTTFLKELNV